MILPEAGHIQIIKAVVIIVGEIDAHASVGAAVAVNGDLREETDFLEGTVAFVMVEKFDHGVVGDEKVNVAVTIVIRKRDAQTFSRFREADFL